MDSSKPSLKSHELTNHVSIHKINTKAPEVDDKNESLTFEGNLYRYKIGGSDSSNTNDLNAWFTYVLYAGLLNFKFRKTRFKVNLGLNLREYYQNINHYLSIKKQKKLSYISRSKEVSKLLHIQDFCTYPNIYAQAVALSKTIKEPEFILLKFGKDDFEGIYFDPSSEKEKQSYVLGQGLSEFLTDLDFNGLKKGRDTQKNKLNQSIDANLKIQTTQYLKNHIVKKINKLLIIKPEALIVVIREKGISLYLGNMLASKIETVPVVFEKREANSLASEGLYYLDDFESYDSYHVKVGVAITNQKTIFTSK